MGDLVLESVSKTLGNTKVLDNLNLEAKDKEFLVILGPSGCGKTTTLRCIAGLEAVDEGRILMDGKEVNNLRAKDRDVAMVFQNYAIYPTMRIKDNIGFPLKVRHVPKQEIDRQVREVAELLRIENLLDRKPGELSGGERQRVALARALIRKPRFFLMDEPLSNLDAKLRIQARTEIKRLQHELGVTTIFVTHDQAEAMAMADRIAVMDKGVIQQVASPLEIYGLPSDAMVAGFVGSPPMNFLDATITRMSNGAIAAKVGEDAFLSPESEGLKEMEGRDVVIGFRPEDTSFNPTPGSSLHNLTAEVYTVEPMGTFTIVTLKSVALIKALLPLDTRLSVGDKGAIEVRKDRVRVFDKTSGKRIV